VRTKRSRGGGIIERGSKIEGTFPRLEAGNMKAAMRVNVPNEYVPLIIKGLEHYYAYTRAVQRDDSR